MKPIAKQSSRKTGFTIIELLTVMSIIVILISLLVPALNMVKRYAKRVKQKNQFHAINVALELFNNEWDGYPNSDAMDSATPPQSYCGAMKLAEAMMGQDLLGFHPDSYFRSDGTIDGTPATDLYPDPPTSANLKARRGPYLKLENANTYRLRDLYGSGNTAPFEEDLFVLCDVYKRINRATGIKTGMPVLYYRANTSGTKHPLNIPEINKNNNISIDDPDNIYDYKDNDELVLLGLPWSSLVPAPSHPMASDNGTTLSGDPTTPFNFYRWIWNDQIEVIDRPYRSDSYILLSAGFDGEYGTRDDIFNFGD